MSIRCFTVVLLCAILIASERAAHAQGDTQSPSGILKPQRIPWTTSRVVGSPDPPPKFKSARVFPMVKFEHPLQITRCPGSDRLFITEEHGKIFSVKPGTNAQADLFFDLPNELTTFDKTPEAKGLEVLYALVFHPQFEQNRYCYLCYMLKSKDKKAPFIPDGTRISRFTVTESDPPRIKPESEEIIITRQGSGHNGCDMHFGPQDGMLYFSTGDGRGPNPPDPLNTGQDCSDLLASIVRIDVDHRDPGLNYSVPKDNPFVGMTGVRPELWAFGFRNAYRMSFDRQTGDLWVGDVGWELWEMVQKVQKGGNYGWSIVEGRQSTKPAQAVGPTPILPPTIELPHTIAASVTGGYVYRGQRFPELVGTYIFGDWETRRIWAARFENDRLQEMPEIVKPNVRVSAFGEDNAGELYYLDYDTGFLYTLERNDVGGANSQFPTKLSETGLFREVKGLEPVAGVVPFSPAVRQWQDGATATHYFAFPGESSVTVFDKPRRLPGQVFWHDFRMKFPADAVLVKHLTLDTTDQKSRPVETQLLHFDGEDWRGYSYAWRDDGSDADLVPSEGAEKLFHVTDARIAGGKREIAWTYHSRNQCTVCHNSWSEYALAISLGQLNARENESNQLIRLSQQGFLIRVAEDDKPLPPFDAKSAAKERSFRSNQIPGSKQEIEERARAYLHVNCSHCHRFGGGGGQVVLEMDFSKPLDEMGLIDVVPRQGDFGIANAKIVKPGDPYGSVLLYRMAKFGRGRMPHLGSELPDGDGLETIAHWIESLGDKPLSTPPPINNLTMKLTKVEESMPVARGLARMGRTGDSEATHETIAAVSGLQPSPIRDLFEGYLPADPRGRKLGNNPKPAAILSLTGDAQRGKALFFAEQMKCAACHKLGDKGGALGPELTTIGKQRRKAELLESLLQPSLQIEPKFAQYIVQSDEGKTFAGLLVSRDDKRLVLRTAEQKEVVLPTKHVEQLRTSHVSLMPDGLIGGLLPQEAADLLEFLATRL